MLPVEKCSENTFQEMKGGGQNPNCFTLQNPGVGGSRMGIVKLIPFSYRGIKMNCEDF